MSKLLHKHAAQVCDAKRHGNMSARSQELARARPFDPAALMTACAPQRRNVKQLHCVLAPGAQSCRVTPRVALSRPLPVPPPPSLAGLRARSAWPRPWVMPIRSQRDAVVPTPSDASLAASGPSGQLRPLSRWAAADPIPPSRPMRCRPRVCRRAEEAGRSIYCAGGFCCFWMGRKSLNSGGSSSSE
jgi:hypothetical protein